MTKSVPSLERRQRERVQTRQKILDAARRMFVQRGYDATTMRAIAAKIGYTPTAIYHHFEDKEALVAELPALDFRAFAQALQAIAAGRLRPEFADADEVAQIAWGAMHGLVALHIAKVDDPWIHWRDVSETAGKACDALIRGLVREPEA